MRLLLLHRVTRTIGAFIAVLSATMAAYGADENVFVIEAPFQAPDDLVISLARLEPSARLHSPAQQLQPRSTWGIFADAEHAAKTIASRHDHNHSADETCEACLAFEQSRREMMARAFDELVAQLDVDESSQDEIDRVQIRELGYEVENSAGHVRQWSDAREWLQLDFGNLA